MKRRLIGRFFVGKYFPDRKIPTRSKERNKFHKEVDKKLFSDPEFARLHTEFETKIMLGVQLIQDAVGRKLPFKIVLMDSWYLAPLIIECLQKHGLDWGEFAEKESQNRDSEFHFARCRGEEDRDSRATRQS